MRKTYITNMPDQAGAFLTASRAIAEIGGNIVRVNYNKAVDTHTLFIEVDADEQQHERISARLKDVEYLANDPGMRQIILIELKLPDVPGAVMPALEAIKSHDVNISYISSQENGTPYQHFKMGLLVENSTEIKDLLDDISQLCEVRVLNYEASDHLLDSTVFYVTFANEMRELLDLTQDETNEVLANASKVMRTLDEREESPSETFEQIRSFAQFVADHAGERFDARVTKHMLADDLTLYAIEPPCGGNMYVLEHYGALLFVDSGLACFGCEMEHLLSGLFDDFAARRKGVALTSADIDSAGLLAPFDTIYLSRTCYENYAAEHRGEPSFRERNVLNAPYWALGKIISRYATPPLGRCAVMGEREGDDLLEPIGSIRFGHWTFEVLEGAGGHARGEMVIACPELRVAFTGGLVSNEEGLSDEQRAFEALRPALMMSADARPRLAQACRDELLSRYEGYTLYPSHGQALVA